jgi:hypothetical protein
MKKVKEVVENKNEDIEFLSIGYIPSRGACLYISFLTSLMFYNILREEFSAGNEFLPAAFFAVFSYAMIGQFAKELKTPHQFRSYYYLLLAAFFVFSVAIWYFIRRSGQGIFLGFFFGFFSYHLLLALFYQPFKNLLNLRTSPPGVIRPSFERFALLSLTTAPPPAKKPRKKSIPKRPKKADIRNK